MRLLCMIPGRGGSKRVRSKNTLPLCGKPLISYSIIAAKEAGVFEDSDIVVSTDTEEISRIASDYGVSCDLRPGDLGGDRVRVVQVIEEYLKREESHRRYDAVVTLLPTCPLRTAEDVRKAVELFSAQDEPGKSLVGVVHYEFPPQLALVRTGDETVRMEFPEAYARTTRSQDIAPRYHAMGAIYIATIDYFVRTGTYFQEEMLAYEMPRESAIDIDYSYQFKIAEELMRAREG